MPKKPRSEEPEPSPVAAVPAVVSGWLIPGLGHFLLGRKGRGIAILLIVTLMFSMGLYMQGELFELDETRPLTFLAGLAEIGVGLPYFVSTMMKWGRGDVRAITYEYGYTFIIVAGLLNMLFVLDAYDIALGRKS